MNFKNDDKPRTGELRFGKSRLQPSECKRFRKTLNHMGNNIYKINTNKYTQQPYGMAKRDDDKTRCLNVA